MYWKQNKIIFNFIINNDYLIKKDVETNNILFIKWSQFEIKCKYFLAFSIDENNNIYWSCENPYFDQKTKYLSYIIKTNMNQTNTFSNNFLNSLKKIIQADMSIIYQEEKINFLWCIIGSYKNFKQFYIITELVYM
jgi:hypothetical protein